MLNPSEEQVHLGYGVFPPKVSWNLCSTSLTQVKFCWLAFFVSLLTKMCCPSNTALFVFRGLSILGTPTFSELHHLSALVLTTMEPKRDLPWRLVKLIFYIPFYKFPGGVYFECFAKSPPNTKIFEQHWFKMIVNGWIIRRQKWYSGFTWREYGNHTTLRFSVIKGIQNKAGIILSHCRLSMIKYWTCSVYRGLLEDAFWFASSPFLLE